MINLKKGQSYLAGSSFELSSIARSSRFDLLEIDGEDASIEKVRSTIKNVHHRPMGKDKYLIIKSAEKLSVQVQNTLLKILEEPPGYLIVIVISEKPNALLPTIRSRLLQINTIQPSSLLASKSKPLNNDYLQQAGTIEELISCFKDRDEFYYYLENKAQLIMSEFVHAGSDNQERIDLLNKALCRLKVNCNWKITAQWLLLRWRSI